MGKKTYQINLVFETPEKFCKYYAQIKNGIIFLPMRVPLPEGASVILHLTIPLLDSDYYLRGHVAQSFEQTSKITGIKIDIKGSVAGIMPEIDSLLRTVPAYSELFEESDLQEHPAQRLPEEEIKDLHQTGEESSVQRENKTKAAREDEPEKAGDVDEKKGLSIEWLRDAVADVEVIESRDTIIEVSDQTLKEKTELTEEEKKRAEPTAIFVMNLTKAMLRSGYYDPDHPGAQDAKKGLYEEFQKIMRDPDELMITNRETRTHSDILLTGILDAPVGVKTLVGHGVAALFVPKLQEFFKKKRLITLAIKKQIPQHHFNKFIDIMSDPTVDTFSDSDDEESAARYLTRQLVANGIKDISAVFEDDLISLERDLPWRVEMAIQRLTKDLRTMPMFAGLGDDVFRRMKQQIVGDIIRPLKHPKLLNDLLVNCYIIASHVEDMDPEDIEEIIVEAFPFNMLIPTMNYTFEEMDRLHAARKRDPKNPVVARRLIAIRRILKLVASRVVLGEAPGAHIFLEKLYEKKLLTFDALPAHVQYIIKTRIMADDLKKNPADYLDAIRKISDPSDGIVYLKCFRRVVPLLIDEEEWDLLSDIAKAVSDAAKRKPMATPSFAAGLKTAPGTVIIDETTHRIFLEDDSIVDKPLFFVFKDVCQKIVGHYIKTMNEPDINREKATKISKFIEFLGGIGIEVLSRVIASSPPSHVYKDAISKLISKGDAARHWAHTVLNAKDRPRKIYIAAMLVLAKTGKSEKDFEPARRFISHHDPGIREAVMDLAVSLRPEDAESILLAMLNDPDPKVRWRAVRALDRLAPISEASMREILGILVASPPSDEEKRREHVNHVVRLISAINAMWYIPIPGRVESDVIAACELYMLQKKGWKRIFSIELDYDEKSILQAALPLLARIGGNASVAFLNKMISERHPMEKEAREAMEKIVKRDIE